MTAKKTAASKKPVVKSGDAEQLKVATTSPQTEPEEFKGLAGAGEKVGADPTGLTDAEINRLTGNGLIRPGTTNYDAAKTMQLNRDKAKQG